MRSYIELYTSVVVPRRCFLLLLFPAFVVCAMSPKNVFSPSGASCAAAASRGSPEGPPVLRPVASAHAERLLACMALEEPSYPFVPRLSPVEGVKNFPLDGGLETRQASILRLRRPTSAVFAAKIVALFEAARRNRDTDVFEEAFVAGEQAAAEELRDCYALAGKAVPAKLHERIFTLSQGKGAILKREIRASVTPLVASVKALEKMEALCKQLFHHGLGRVAAPIFFLMEHCDKPVKECLALLETGRALVQPGAGAPLAAASPAKKRKATREVESTPESARSKRRKPAVDVFNTWFAKKKSSSAADYADGERKPAARPANLLRRMDESSSSSSSSGESPGEDHILATESSEEGDEGYEDEEEETEEAAKGEAEDDSAEEVEETMPRRDPGVDVPEEDSDDAEPSDVESLADAKVAGSPSSAGSAASHSSRKSAKKKKKSRRAAVAASSSPGAAVSFAAALVAPEPGLGRESAKKKRKKNRRESGSASPDSTAASVASSSSAKRPPAVPQPLPQSALRRDGRFASATWTATAAPAVQQPGKKKKKKSQAFRRLASPQSAGQCDPSADASPVQQPGKKKRSPRASSSQDSGYSSDASVHP